MKDVWPKVESGEVRPTVYKVLPITEANAAHALLRDGESVGKVVLTVKDYTYSKQNNRQMISDVI